MKLELARLQVEELKKENERLKLQTNDLWNLLANEGFNSEEQYIIEALIEGNGEEYVKRVFAEDYRNMLDKQKMIQVRMRRNSSPKLR